MKKLVLFGDDESDRENWEVVTVNNADKLFIVGDPVYVNRYSADVYSLRKYLHHSFPTTIADTRVTI